ncbi:S8 family serine peptidase [Candidatus Parabeggiatoa sp. HSG14]|uniref:S8 family serine peptidase n=1 Tax=Candidatus Parabeggiatoa sp. HSG14 TaxID=3055593 RepID=UPI0025A88F48|nr:S8 family serine peptidase [Thiotrichales bacterium HSG14]
MKICFFIYRVVIILSMGCLSTTAYAARVLIHLTHPISEIDLAQISTQAHIIYDLRPLLPWLVLETANTPHRKRTHIAGIFKKWAIQSDVQGYFATMQTPSTTIPNDPRYAEQWHLNKIGVPTFWKKTQGEGIIIALLDSGVYPSHPDLSANILFEQGYDFGDKDDKPYDGNGHGTAMAGLMVAQCHNYKGVCGVAPSAKIIPYKINQQDKDQFFASDLAAAILAAANSSAKILSLSLVLNKDSQLVQDALRYAKTQDKIVVAAAGNEGNNTVAYPANLPWIVGVGAFDKKGQRLRKSNYGNGLSLSAPGIDLLTTLPGTGYADWYDGTSAAAALVSGVLALMAARQPTVTAPELISTLLASCQDVNTPGFDSQYGFGHLNVPNSFSVTTPTLEFIPVTAELLSPGESLKLDLYVNNVSGLTVDLYLRLNIPSDNHQGERHSLYKVWNNSDNVEPIPYNLMIASPYLCTHDFSLSLYGTPTALLGHGLVGEQMYEGAYELLALLTLSDNSTVQTRKIVWITNNNPK